MRRQRQETSSAENVILGVYIDEAAENFPIKVQHKGKD
jgi:hypothetical protein